MNIVKTKNDKKGLYAIVLFLVFSLVLNFVLFSNLSSQGEVIAAEQQEEIDDKNESIVLLEEKIKLLEEETLNSQPEKKEEISATQLEKQRAYKEVANTFVNAYLNYDSSHLAERREEILSITNEKLVNEIAPEVSEEGDGSSLSSDPTFVSSVKDVTLYLTEVNETLNVAEVMADVNFLNKNTEGESTARSFIYLQLTKEEDGSIRISDYTYYPIK